MIILVMFAPVVGNRHEVPTLRPLTRPVINEALEAACHLH